MEEKQTNSTQVDTNTVSNTSSQEVQQSQPSQIPQQTVIINGTDTSNGLGTAGFVLALIALFLGWIPIIGWLLWLLGLIFSVIGVFKKPRGFAIAGLIISLLEIIVVMIFLGGVGAFLMTHH